MPEVFFAGLSDHALKTTRAIKKATSRSNPPPALAVGVVLKNLANHAVLSLKKTKDAATTAAANTANAPVSGIAAVLRKLARHTTTDMARVSIAASASANYLSPIALVLSRMNAVSLTNLASVQRVAAALQAADPMHIRTRAFVDAVAQLSLRSVRSVLHPGMDRGYLSSAAAATGLLALSPVLAAGLLGKVAFDAARRAAAATGVTSLKQLSQDMSEWLSPSRKLTDVEKEAQTIAERELLEAKHGVAMETPLFDDRKVTVVEDLVLYDGTGKRKRVARKRSLMGARAVMNADKSPGVEFVTNRDSEVVKQTGQRDSFFGEDESTAVNESADLGDGGASAETKMKVNEVFAISERAHAGAKKARAAIAALAEATKTLGGAPPSAVNDTTNETEMIAYLNALTTLARSATEAGNKVSPGTDIENAKTGVSEVLKGAQDARKILETAESNKKMDVDRALVRSSAGMVARDLDDTHKRINIVVTEGLRKTREKLSNARDAFSGFNSAKIKEMINTKFPSKKSDLDRSVDSVESSRNSATTALIAAISKLNDRELQ